MSSQDLTKGLGGWARRSGAPFALVTGLLLGVLIAALALPRGTTTVRVVRGTGADAGGSAGAAAGAGGPGAAPTAGGVGVPGSPGAAGAGPVTGAGSAPAAGRGRGATPGAGGGVASGAAVTGVSGSDIVVGIGVPDLGALKALGANYDWGDPQVEMEAVLDGWKRRGLVPVNGRNVTFVYARYGIFSADEQRAACQSLVVDHHAFAVADFHLFGPGTQCVAVEHHTPLVVADPSGITDSLLQQGSPWLFSLPMSESRMLRNWPDWAASKGYLDGKTVGVYYDATLDPDVADNLLPALDRVGHHPKLVVSTSQNMGGPDDVVAMEKLRGAGVNLVMMNISALNQTNFMQHAEAVGYRPAYLENDFEENSDNTATGTFPPAQFDGSYGMAGQASGEAGSNRPVPAATEACVANYLRYSGDSRPAVGSAKWDNVLIACDLGAAVLSSIQGGGRDLTPAGYVAAMQGIRSLPMDMFPPVTFGPNKHSGVDSVRTLRWAGACKCWGIVQDYTALMRP